jgi:hypothetical protein
MSMGAVIAEFRSELSRRRAALQAHRQLARELATYSAAERLDLQATLDRYPTEQTSEIRTILSRQAA